jgi:hypothetical protein
LDTIGRGRNILKLVVPIENDAPSEFFDLGDEPCLDEVDRTFVYAKFWLKERGLSRRFEAIENTDLTTTIAGAVKSSSRG